MDAMEAMAHKRYRCTRRTGCREPFQPWVPLGEACLAEPVVVRDRVQRRVETEYVVAEIAPVAEEHLLALWCSSSAGSGK